MEQPTASLRINPANRNHHLWNNNGVWSIHLTLHLPGFTKLRLRRSLHTRSVAAARRLRNRFFRQSSLSNLIAPKKIPVGQRLSEPWA
jgi:hypothetical protein